MKKIQLTKNELKKQKDALKRYHRYLPTLMIKKQQLQKELLRIKTDIEKLENNFNTIIEDLNQWISLAGEDVGIEKLIRLNSIETKNDNIAGVDIPIFINTHISTSTYDLMTYPLWVDKALEALRNLITLKSEILVLKNQETLIFDEFRITSQRVNLFEKVKIPQAEHAIKHISIYIADQQTTAIGWARIAKKKKE
ncbi:V-type ATPase subunit D [Candidatus Magnetoovum chiemensis]|nr:V-type ATPase subunit D [Candidatus Magnetoovum chiemensis]